jgi:hypothetical protein
LIQRSPQFNEIFELFSFLKIKVEKYLTPEQRKLLEDQLAEEAKRRELEKLDNWRERGLMDMMGGVLQVRREDELKKVKLNHLFCE